MTQRQKTHKLLAELGEKIRKYRWDNRLTMDDLAKKSGISKPTLIGLEKNTLPNTSINKIMTIADALGIQISLTFSNIKKVISKEENLQ